MRRLISYSLQSFSAIGHGIENTLGKEHASIVYIILNVLILFSAMAFTRIHNGEFSSLQGQFWRGCLHCLLTYIVLQEENIPIAINDPKKERFRLLRGFLGGGQVIFVFLSLKKLSISDVYIVQTSVTPLFTGIYDWIILKNKYNKSEISLALVSIIGVTMIVKPDLFLASEVSTQATTSFYAEGTERLLWIVMLIIVQAIWCLGGIVLKMLAGMHPIQVSYHYGLLCCLLSSIAMVATGEYQIISWGLTLQVILVFGFGGFLNQVVFVKAFQLGKPGKMGLLMNLFVVCGFLFEIFYLEEYPSFIKSTGAVIVLVCSVMIALQKFK